MVMVKYLSLLIVVAGFTSLTIAIDRNFLFNSERFPEPEAVPTLSNGNLGFTVFSDNVHLTGVYNGRLERSHRARIPNYGHFQLPQCSRPETNPPHCAYQLDIKFGRFRTTYDDPNQQMRLVHSVYPHRYFSQTLVNHFRLERLSGSGVLSTNIQYTLPEPSTDISFQPNRTITIQNEVYQYQCGRTNEVEDPMLQPQGTDVCVYYQDYPTILELPTDRDVADYIFLTVFATSSSSAENEIRLLTFTDLRILEQTQENHMNQMWDKYGVTVDGNDELDRAIKASAFQLFSNVPSLFTPHATRTFGISPTGIGRGGTVSEGFQGHNFWDFDMWIFPTILMVDRLVARELLQYRTRIVRGALADNARREGHEGWKYPWASAFTGREISSTSDFMRFQHHVTGDVAFALRQYLLATEDLTWMLTEGCEIAYETARFWKNQTEYNPSTDKYGIRGVTGPDNINLRVNNNAFTNGVAAHNLFLGEYAGCLCRTDLLLEESQWQQLTKIARSIQLLHDDVSDFTPQFEGYTVGTPIGQADAVLLGYPLELPLEDSTKRNNLEIYAQATLANTSAMTWSMHAISWLDLDEMDRAAEDLRKSYQPYMRPPFHVWNERPAGYSGATNFVTGAGGFLQAILNGYAGIRYRVDEMVIHKPRLPPGATRMIIPEINYMRGRFALEIYSNGTFRLTSKPEVTLPMLEIFIDNQEVEMCSPRDTCHYTGSFSAVLKVVRTDPSLNRCTLKPTTLNQVVGTASTAKPVLYLAVLLLIFSLMQ